MCKDVVASFAEDPVARSERFIEQINIGIEIARHRKGQTAAHSGGEVLQGRMPEIGQFGPLQNFVELQLQVLAHNAVHGPVEINVVFDIEFVDHANAEPGKQSGLAVYLDAAGSGRMQAGHHAEQGRFPRAVVPDQPHPVAPMQLEIDRVQGGESIPFRFRSEDGSQQRILSVTRRKQFGNVRQTDHEIPLRHIRQSGARSV